MFIFKAKKSNKAPIGTLEYIVDVSDTIERVALKWNTIPSDILHLNRLSTRMLYPGQVLFVPDPQYMPPEPIVVSFI
jgi:LysM repeat protein